MNAVVKVNNKELENWKKRIEEAWKTTVKSVIETGQLVKQAKEKLGVSFSQLEAELPFSSTVAHFLIKIAENKVLTNPSNYAKLPNGYNTLYYLSNVEEKELERQIEDGIITPNFTLERAKNLRSDSPKKSNVTDVLAKAVKKTSYEVGVISISSIQNIGQFENDLNTLLKKYNGNITYTNKDSSVAVLHKQNLLNLAYENISKAESQLEHIDIDQLRMLEDACFFISKKKNQSFKTEILLNGELVERVCIPHDYKDFKKICKLIGVKEITRHAIQEWCKEHKIPNQFVDIKSMDKEFYVWEQVRLILEKKDVIGAKKRLKDMSSHGRQPKIKSLASKLLLEVNKFSNKD
jgi:hypothetical protein